MNKEKNIIIGLAGQIASGKGKVADYLENNHGAKVIKYSDVLKEIVERLYLEVNRDNLQKLSTSLREIYGENILARVIEKDIENISNKMIVVDGVRRNEDITNLKKNSNFYLIYVKADLRTRYKRITGRREKGDDKNKTFEEFKKDHLRETELKIEKLRDKADLVVDNNGTVKELENQIKKFIKNVK